MGAAEQPLLSIIVCTLNRRDDLIRTLSYFADEETYSPFEVIVVDQNDEPDPVTEVFLHKNSDRFRLIHRYEKSLPKSRNVGIELARGEIIIFVDDDAEPLPGFLAGHAAAFSDAGIWGATGPVFDPGPRRLVPAQSLMKTDIDDLNSGGKVMWDADFAYDISWLPGCNMSIRRSAFEKIGNFDEMFEVHCDDAEISHRIKLAGGRLRYTPAAQVVHHQRQTGGTRADPVKSAQYVRKYVRSLVFFKLQMSALPPAEVFKILRRVMLSRQSYRNGQIGLQQIVAFWRGVADARKEFSRRMKSSQPNRICQGGSRPI